MDKLGNCYEVAGRYMLNNPHTDFILIHAEVIGQGQLEGIPYGHAFLLDPKTNMIHDYSNNRNLVIPKEIYFILGKINETRIWTDDGVKERTPKIYEYTRDEAMFFMSNTGTFGPWELETEYGY